MFTFHDRILKGVGGFFTALGAAMAFCAVSATEVRAQPAPPNDNLTNAQGIIGTSGTVTGTNQNATAQPGEPAPYPGNPAQASIWYVWTAPITTTMDFSTLGSTYPLGSPLQGQPLETVLAVYTLTSGTTVAFTNLTQVASNEDDPSGGMTSRVDFPVTRGTMYFIQVDGSQALTPGTNAQGIIVLNWNPSLVGGSFGFSSTAYQAGQYDDTFLVQPPGSVSPSIYGHPQGTNNVRITVTRTGGFNGRCQVTFIATNGFYTNVYETNYTGTNIYLTNYNGAGQIIGFTNSYFTNVAYQNFVQNAVEGGVNPEEVPGLYTVTQTNENINNLADNFGRPVTNYPTIATLGLQDFFTNFYCEPLSPLPSISGPNTISNSTMTNIVWTNVFCYTYITNVVTPSAQSGVDYVGLTTNMIFDDFQMSQDVYLQVNASLGPDYPDINGNYSYAGINSKVALILTNAMPDPYEDPNIVPPTIPTNGATSELTILSFYSLPYNSGATLTTNNSTFGSIGPDGSFLGSGSVTINWERATFRVNKGVGTAYLWAVVTGSPANGASYTVSYTIDTSPPNILLNVFEWNRFPTVAGSDYAIPPVNGLPFYDFGVPINNPQVSEGTTTTWGAVSGTITIGPYPDFGARCIAIPINDNPATEFDSDIYVEMFETTGQASANASQMPPGAVGNIFNANLTINFGGNPPGGSVDTGYNPPGTANSYPVFNPTPGANGSVQAVAMQVNGQAVIGGSFSSFDSISTIGVARLLSTGLLDTSFNPYPGTGISGGGYVDAIAIDSSGRIIIGGYFKSYDGKSTINIARLNYNGSLDTNFNSGVGFNSYVYALALDTNGNILVGGDFTSYNTTNCNHIARLLPNGGLDPSFLPDTGNGNPNYGTDQDVQALATDGNGNIVLGGQFSYVNGSNMSYVARLLPSGATDPSFNPEIGPDGYVYGVAVEPNNEILIGGAFQNYNLVSRNSIALLNTAGVLDTAFNPGTGADNTIYSVVLQPDGNILVGGQFQNFNTTRRMGIARLLPSGWLDTTFMDGGYNQFAGFTSTYYNAAAQSVFAMALEPSLNVVVGGAFSRAGGGATRSSLQTCLNVTRLIGQGGTSPTNLETGGAGNCPGNITLTQNPYTVDDIANKLYVSLDRVNGSVGPATVTLGTNTLAPGPGAATAADFGLAGSAVSTYLDVWTLWSIEPFGSYGWRESDGYYGYNFSIQPPYSDGGAAGLNLTIRNDPSALQNLFASLSLLDLNSFGLLALGGVTIPTQPALGMPTAQLEIINDNFPPGLFGFSVTNFTTVNTSNKVVISVLRTNGSAGEVELQYYTGNNTAISGIDYTGIPLSANKTLIFEAGQTSNGFTVTIDNQNGAVPTKYFTVYLTNVALNTGNGLTPYTNAFDTNIPPLLTSNATVTIIDGNFAAGHLSFTSPTFTVLKAGQATVSVERLGGALGQLMVQCGTSDGTAVNGLNYTGVTNTLVWSNQDISIKTMTIQTLQDNTVEGTKTVNVSLFNATNVGNTSSNNLILISPSNAVLNILDSDSYGGLSFAVQNFNILENAGQALITVIRTNGTTGTISVSFTNFGDTNAVLPYYPAVAGTNFGVTNGVLTFGPGVTSTNFIVPIYDTSVGEASGTNRVVTLELFNGNPSAIANQFPVFATLTILDPNLVLNPAGAVDVTTLNGTGFNGFVQSLALQPDGSILAGGDFTFFNQYPFDYLARLNPNGDYDSTFLFNLAGANAPVQQILSQPPGASQTNGDIVIVGSFTQVDEVNRSGVARLNLDGSLDETFNPGSGADSTVLSIAETFLPAGVASQPPTLAYYIGGNFANFDGAPAGGITRLNASTNSLGYQGTVDPNFKIGQGVTSSNAAVRALAVQANGQVVLGGDFTAFNGMTYNHLVRLNVDGSVDTTFNPSTGSDPTGSVRAIVIQPNSQILIGGLFTNVNGSNYNYLARLNIDGSLDTNFNVGVGGNNSVLALAIDSQERILVGGEFTRFSGVTRSGITRLNPDGTIDPTINFESGADGGFVDTIVIQTNDEIDVGGGFTTFEGIAENNFVRLYGGATSGDGSIQFSQAAYGVLENATNAVITLQRLGGEGTANQPTVSIVFYTTDGSGVAGTDYVGVTNTVTFPFGETFETVTVPILNGSIAGSNKTVNLNLSNAVYANYGQLASAVLIITNVNTAVSFSAQTYRESADVPGGDAIIPVVRIGNPNSTVSVTVYTGTNGTATPYTNYIPVTNVLVFTPGVMTNDFLVPVLNATNMFSDQTVDLELSNPSNALIGTPSSATLTIANVFSGPGVLSFSQTNYVVSEGATNAVITIIRTNGSSGQVAVTLTTSNGTAVSGVNYSNVQQIVVFPDSVVSATVSIPLIQQVAAGPDTTVYLTLSNPQPPISQGGPSIGYPSQVILTIQNDIENFSFANSPYFVGEGAGTVTLDIVRGGPISNTASVSYGTYSPPNASESNGYAVPNVDYVPMSGTLTFTPNETFTTISIPIIPGDVVNGPLTFQVVLSNPSPNGVQIGTPGTTSVTILSDVTGFELSTNSYTVAENGSNLVITVDRLNPDTGVASVQFATSDGTAINHVDYVGTNGTLNFLNGQTTDSFTITILNPNIVENNKSFTVTLSNPQVQTQVNAPTNAFLLSPSNATVTITNVLTGVSFASPTYTVSECGVTAVIPVVLTGSTNGIVSVICSTTNGGSASPGTNYFPATTNFTFLPGQTTTNFYVQVINNHVIGPDHTVILTLSGVQGAQLLNPSTAVLTIEECNGAYIVKSGTAFVSGSLSPAGAIFAGETVTLLLGLRDIAGVDTTNLVATLLATNGVTNVSGPQNYGVLITNGPTVARAFTFTALGTNGQNIAATLTLQDGSEVYSNVAFGFTLGGATNIFSTNETLLLAGTSPLPSKAYNSNPPYYGYPSVIDVSGIVGTITGVTATLKSFGHSSPRDVAVVLEAPTGQATYLMADCGGVIAVGPVNLTFSQSASSSLPSSSALTSGTYLPTTYDSPPLPATNGAPVGPYPTTLANFVGQSPNGVWSLFVADEDTLDSGGITNGWSLNISTGISVEEDSDLGLSMTVSPAAATLSNTLVYTIDVTNYGPAAATNVVITDTLPAGASYVSNSCNCAVGTNGLLTFTVATLPVSNGVSFSFSVVPTALGYITNIAVAIANEPNPNSNNAQTNILLVSPPSADLAVTLSGSPNPVLDGADVTYIAVVTNNGPSAATGVTAIDVLPAGFLPITITPTQGVASNVNGTITWNVGALGSVINSSAALTIVVGVNLPEQSLPSSANLDSVTVSSPVYDPTKQNNYAAVKTEVEPATISVTSVGGTYMLSWAATVGNTVLQGSKNLPPIWVPITNSSVVPQTINGQLYNTYTLPGSSGYHFFRLMSQLP